MFACLRCSVLSATACQGTSGVGEGWCKYARALVLIVLIVVGLVIPVAVCACAGWCARTHYHNCVERDNALVVNASLQQGPTMVTMAIPVQYR
jgi:hypothetical protein